jgi:hypothetical protein
MGQVIDGRSTDIHPHMMGIERDEPLLPAAQAVVDDQFGHVAGTQGYEARVVRQTGARINANAGRGNWNRVAASEVVRTDPNS